MVIRVPGRQFLTRDDDIFCLLLVIILCAGILALYSYHHINFDVAVLVWAAERVSSSEVYGRDILDVSPPLCMLIYMPAVLLSHAVGFDWGVRIWMAAIAAASVMTLWHTADKSLRRGVAAVLAIFFLLAFPEHFAQREQMALLLCAPYIAGPARGRGWAAASGAMAGVGFLIKPHFLIPLALIWALRRRAGIEEAAILGAGIGYGLSLILFFQPYLLEMLPKILATYWAISSPANLVYLTIAIACFAGQLALVGRWQLEARPYLLATLGFTAAAFLQQKGFYYHFLPGFGFLAMYTAATMGHERRFAAGLAKALLLFQVLIHAGGAAVWLVEEAESRPSWTKLHAEIDNSRSFASLTAHPMAFPKAMTTSSRFVGIALCQIFMPAVIAQSKGINSWNSETVGRLALDQAIRELRNQPDLVIVSSKNHNGEDFDVLGWLKRDPAFRALWADYHATRQIETAVIYRRK